MLDLAVQRYPCRSGDDIQVFFHDLIYLLLLCGEIGYRDPRCGYDLSLIVRVNHEEDKLPCLRDDLSALLGLDQGNNTGWDYLGYPIQFLVQSNHNTMRPRLIYSMTFP